MPPNEVAEKPRAVGSDKCCVISGGYFLKKPVFRKHLSLNTYHYQRCISRRKTSDDTEQKYNDKF